MTRIEDYALIGDCETAALVGRDGSVDWLCFPRFDSDSCFARLIGTEQNGYWRLCPVGRCTSERRYRPGPLILETTFKTDSGRVRVIDFMPPRTASSKVVRIVEGLEGKVEMTDVLLRTNVDKLTILPSGTPHAKATELLASDAMERLLDDMATRYADRIIIFDSPPLLLTTESPELASHMGQIVVVVHADRTLQSTVQQAIATIDACPVKLMVLNKARGDSAGSYGG